MSIEYTVYECMDESKKNIMYNLYKHDLGGDFYLATFRYLDDLKNYLIWKMVKYTLVMY